MVIGIIMFTSIFVIRNSFNISLTEKDKRIRNISKYRGNKKTNKKKVFLFEGVILAIISIPLGILIEY